jgi:hypothetical protein
MSNNVEEGRYFLTQSTLFDRKFLNGKFILRDRFDNKKNWRCVKKRFTNIVNRLRTFEYYARKYQSLVSNMETELQKAPFGYSSDKLKQARNLYWYNWDKIHNIHREIAI